MPYAELDLTGMDFDTAEREFSVLKASFGEGYGAGALAGSSAGLHLCGNSPPELFPVMWTTAA
jgi:hypothetical protein